MTCEHYWREGVLRVERGEPDPHRDACADCQREHLSRAQLVAALPLIGSLAKSDPAWEARVWNRIARLDTRPRRQWFLASLFGTTCVLVAVLGWMVLREAEPSDMPHIEVVPGESPRRAISTSPIIGDQIRITVKPGDEVRIYHGEDIVLCCPAGTTSGGCVSDGRGLVAEAKLRTPGNYKLVVIAPDAARAPAADARVPSPSSGFSLDLRVVVDAGYSVQVTQLWVQ